jgi:hypothetical protein
MPRTVVYQAAGCSGKLCMQQAGLVMKPVHYVIICSWSAYVQCAAGALCMLVVWRGRVCRWPPTFAMVCLSVSDCVFGGAE